MKPEKISGHGWRFLAFIFFIIFAARLYAQIDFSTGKSQFGQMILNFDRIFLYDPFSGGEGSLADFGGKCGGKRKDENKIQV